MPPDRRNVIAGGLASLAAAPAFASADAFADIEAKVGGRLGVAVLDTGSGRQRSYRAGERFPMCSTFKAMAVAALLSRVDRGLEHLDRFVPYDEAHLLPYAPITRARVKEGGLPMADLCAAAIEESDNTAANLILASIGGPAGWTGFVRSIGDVASRLDRTEPTLNTAIRGDPRDTTTPLASLGDLHRTVLGKVLSVGSRSRLAGWMTDCKTGNSRLRAGFPATWRVADKTGTGDLGTANDIAVASTSGAPIIVVCYLTGAERATPAAREAAIAEVGRLVTGEFRPEDGLRG